ncbi:hypothetical protein NL676_039064 [Syzygium grande]|nr:hypothetical protein NL676_039064 [Syzygium grande]
MVVNLDTTKHGNTNTNAQHTIQYHVLSPVKNHSATNEHESRQAHIGFIPVPEPYEVIPTKHNRVGSPIHIRPRTQKSHGHDRNERTRQELPRIKRDSPTGLGRSSRKRGEFGQMEYSSIITWNFAERSGRREKGGEVVPAARRERRRKSQVMMTSAS